MDAISPANPASLLPDRQIAAIERKAEEFEALMLAEFLKPIFETAKSSSLFGGSGAAGSGPEQSMFGAMLQEKYAEGMAARGGIGIADQVKAALIDMQSQLTTEQRIAP